MKKKTLFLLLFAFSLGFAQNQKQNIQQYLNENKSKLKLTSQDVQEWFIESELSSTSTGINNYFAKQKFQGIEIFNSLSNFWIKNNKVIKGGEEFISNLSLKVETTTANIDAIKAITSAISEMKIKAGSNFQIIETINPYSFKISNGTLDPITAKLVYQLIDNKNYALPGI